RAAPDRVDEDIDAAVLVDDALHCCGHLRGVERVGHETVGGPARGPDGAHDLVERFLVDLDADDRSALAADDLGRRPPDAAARGGDQRGLALESHGLPPLVCAPRPAGPQPRDGLWLRTASYARLTLGSATCLVNSRLLRSRP